MKSEIENNQQSDSVTPSRRKFLKRTSAGVFLASIPGKSVWASSNGLMVSVLASANGSGSSIIQDPIQLGSAGYWKNHYSNYKSYKFSQIFGGKPIKRSYKTYGSDYTLQEILDNPGSGRNGYGGKSNVNYHMVAMYLNAAHSGEVSGIYYPIIEQGDFYSLNEFADYLYTSGYSSPDSFGQELSALIDEYNRG